MADGSRLEHLLDSFISRSRAHGEWTVALARVVISALLVLRIVVVGPTILMGTPRQALHLGMLVTSVLAAIYVRREIRKQRPRMSLFVGVSVTVDALTMFTALLALVVWPPPGYQGLTQSPASAWVFGVLSFAVLRFSMPLVLASIGSNAVSLVTLLAIEHYHFGRAIDTEGLITIITIFIATSAFCLTAVSRAGRLVHHGARAVLDAERATHHLGAYVSTEVAERALSGDELALGGNRQPVVCLFSDLRGFTSYSESLPPEQLVGEVNDYLEAMVAAATSEGGIIDKYIGDAIMVVFGTGKPLPDDCSRAIRTARAMQRAMAKHNLSRVSRGLPPLAQGIGIHAGVAVVGNIGTKSRMQHTVMGSIVNIASRLEAATKELDVPVLVSADVVDVARETGGPPLPTLQPLPPMAIRGLSIPLPVFTFASDGIAPSLSGIAAQ